MRLSTKEEAGRAAEQHICLCRNEDLLLPDEKVEELSEAEFGRLPGFELRFGQTEHSFLVGLIVSPKVSRCTDGWKSVGNL